MRKIEVLVLGVCAILTTGVTAAAQEQGQTGIAMGYPASVAIIWHATDRLALRPEVSISKTSSESTSSNRNETSTDSLSAGFAVSALFYLNKSNGLSTYIVPRVGYSRSSVESEARSSFSGTHRGESTVSTVSFAGSFGAQYSLTRRFGVFGEVGVMYSDADTDSGPSAVESGGWAVGTRSTAGVILYF